MTPRKASAQPSSDEEIAALEAEDVAEAFGRGGAPSIRAVRDEPLSAFAVRLPAAVIEELAGLAEARHIPTSVLLRNWIVERLGVESQRPNELGSDLWDAATSAALEAVPEIARSTARRLGTKASA
jgi:hypothetical protein